MRCEKCKKEIGLQGLCPYCGNEFDALEPKRTPQRSIYGYKSIFKDYFNFQGRTNKADYRNAMSIIFFTKIIVYFFNNIHNYMLRNGMGG